jgi:DNA-binding transcriptional ArsR family regulator
MLNHMVEHQTERLDAVFHALSDPTRRAMLHSLAFSERSIGELASPFRMSFAAASKHVKALEKAGLVKRRIEGRRHICQLESRRLAEAHDWLSYYEKFWTARLDQLERELRKSEKRTKRSNR